MTDSDATKDTTNNEAASTRAGGNVESKGGAQSEGTAGGASTRAGGNVESKGASGGANEKDTAGE